MGAFVANFQVRGADGDAVRRAIAEIGASQIRVIGPSNGWSSVYEDRASTQDEEWIAQVAVHLSARLRTACVAFMVHDSDIARYWLSDNGKLLDEYNSIPDYFDQVSAAEKRRVRGRADVLVRYCRPGVSVNQIESVLRADVTFAEDIITQLAEFLGIDPERALGDFNHPDSGDGGGGLGDDDDDDEFDEDVSGSFSGRGGPSSMLQKVQQQFARMFATPNGHQVSPQSTALVEAAAAGNIAEIEKLVDAGTDVNAMGELPLEAPGMASLSSGMGLVPKVSLSPLMGAASRGQAAAAKRLLELGANAHEDHLLYGSALHVAAQAGSPETVRLMLAAGISAQVKSRQGLTPRAQIQAVRNQIQMTKQMAKAMPQLQGMMDQLESKLASLPEAGWTACDELLRAAGG